MHCFHSLNFIIEAMSTKQKNILIDDEIDMELRCLKLDQLATIVIVLAALCNFRPILAAERDDPGLYAYIHTHTMY